MFSCLLWAILALNLRGERHALEVFQLSIFHENDFSTNAENSLDKLINCMIDQVSCSHIPGMPNGLVGFFQLDWKREIHLDQIRPTVMIECLVSDALEFCKNCPFARDLVQWSSVCLPGSMYFSSTSGHNILTRGNSRWQNHPETDC